MIEPSWERVRTSTGPSVIEENWLFQLRRERYQSRQSGLAHDFFIIKLADAVQVIAITEDHKILMVRQFRAGSERDSLEPPGGLFNRNESVLTAAVRELEEETGYTGDPPRLLGEAWSNPSLMTSKIYTVVVMNAKKHSNQNLDPGEEVRLELIPVGEVPLLLKDGKIDHALGAWGLTLWLAAECDSSRIADGFALAKPRGSWRATRLLIAASGIAALGIAGRSLISAALFLVETFPTLWLVACLLGGSTVWLRNNWGYSILVRPRLVREFAWESCLCLLWVLAWFVTLIFIAILFQKLDLIDVLKFAW